MRIRIALTAACALLLAACGPKWQEAPADGFQLVTQKGGATLGYTSAPLLTVDRFAFAGDAAWGHVGYKVDKSLEIKDPKPGKYYISVFCATTVTATTGKYGVEYSGRTDVLNGVPYKIQVNLE